MENKKIYVLRKTHLTSGISENILASMSIDKIISTLDEEYLPEENRAGYSMEKISDRQFAVTNNSGSVIAFYRIDMINII